jgi:exopolysaccharide biosynthesis polyprenyl glycosylphosphotransferase
MIAYRQRGLLNLHILLVTLLAVLWFFVLVEGVNYVPYLPLNPDVRTLIYGIFIGVAMFSSSRSLGSKFCRFDEISLVNAAKIAVRQVLFVAFVSFGLVFATKDVGMSRAFLGNYLVTLWLVLVIANRRLPQLLSRIIFQKNRKVRALMIGSSARGVMLADWLRGKQHVGINLVGRLSKDSMPGDGLPDRLGNPSELARVIEEKGISQVVLLDGAHSNPSLPEVLSICQAAGCRLLVYNDFLERLPVAMNAIIEDGHHFLTAQDEPLEDPVNRACKRVFDVMISLPVVILILPPLCLLVCVMQRLQSPGALFFARPRGGQRGNQFNMLKFRSMRVANRNANAEAQQAKYADARIFPFGHFLRKTSLDEFPQFFNVLKGEMSIVGPRPHLPEHDLEFSSVAKTYRTRQLVKPGITGLAQIRGYRGEITDPQLLHQRVKSDIEYITNWTIGLDIQITLATALQVLVPPPSAR